MERYLDLRKLLLSTSYFGDDFIEQTRKILDFLQPLTVSKSRKDIEKNKSKNRSVLH